MTPLSPTSALHTGRRHRRGEPRGAHSAVWSAVAVAASLALLAGCSSDGHTDDPADADSPSATLKGTPAEAAQASFVEQESTTCAGIDRDELDRWFIQYGFGGVRVGSPGSNGPCEYPLSDPDAPSGEGPTGRLTVDLTDSAPASKSDPLGSWSVDDVHCDAYADGKDAAVAQCEMPPGATLLVRAQLDVPSEYIVQATSSSLAALLELLTPEIVPFALAAMTGQPPPEAPAQGPSLELAEVEKFCAERFVPAMNNVDPLDLGKTWAITKESHPEVGFDSEYGVSEYPDQSRTTCGIGPDGGSSVGYFTVYRFPFNDIQDADLEDDPITAEEYKSQHPDWDSGYIEVDNVESCRISGDQFLYCIQSWTQYRANDVLDAVFGEP